MRGRGTHDRAPALGFGHDLTFAVALHLQAVQAHQQNRSWQVGCQESARATGDDSNDAVAPGELFEESGDPVTGWAAAGSSTMGDSVPSKSLKIPAAAGSRRSGASGSLGSRATM